MFRNIQIEAAVAIPKQLLLDMKVRWSSTYIMLHRAERNKKVGLGYSCIHQLMLACTLAR
jgi:hypothetical protein